MYYLDRGQTGKAFLSALVIQRFFKYDLQQMFKAITLIVILAIASSRLLQADAITGTLTVKSAAGKDSKTLNVKAGVNSAEITNIAKQLIKVIIPAPSDGCSTYTSFSSTDELVPVYYLVTGDEGECSYGRKVELAKKALGSGIIIIDSPQGVNNLRLRPNERDNFVILLVSKDQVSSFPKDSKSFLAQLNMLQTNPKTKKASLEIWVSSLNRQSYHVLSWWAKASSEVKSLSSTVDWHPRFAYYSCSVSESCKAAYVPSCACGGQFCSPEQHGKSSNVLVREDIRQQLIFQRNSSLYLTYAQKFFEKCYDSYVKSQFTEDCSMGIIHELDIDSGINHEIDSFLQTCEDQADTNNFKIYKALSLDRAKYTQIGHYPTTILNHEQLEFKNPEELKGLLCRRLGLEKQQGCVSIIGQTTILATVVTGFFYIILTIVLVVAGAFAVVFFRNKLRKEMNKQLKMQVSTAVQHYFTLSENR